jgi:hypothetical protein
MPGTLMGAEMTTEDALVLLALDTSVAETYVSAEHVSELRRAASAVVEAAGIDAIRRYAPQPEARLRLVETEQCR